MRNTKRKNFIEMMIRDRSEDNTEGNMSWNCLEKSLTGQA